jgi:UBX domain-containing protein 6
MDTMGSKVRKFFAKKKSDAKFSKAGPGRKLTGDASGSGGGSSSRDNRTKDRDAYVPVKREDLTDEMKKARDAALDRMNKTAAPTFDLSLKAIKEKARKELEEESKKKKVESEISSLKINDDEPKEDENTVDINFACPLISDEILPKKEWKQKIKDFLYEQLALTDNIDCLDPSITSCLIIKSCNSLERAEDCIETLKKYLSNILQNPDETKFHKIRMSNRIFCDKVANVEGSAEFLKNAGFSEQVIDGESFLVWSPESSIENLLKLVDYLNECETIQLELDRNIQVLLPSQNNTISLSQDFFKLTSEELKREQMTK